MLRTVVMTWEWQELPVDIGSEVEKLEGRITPENKDAITNSFWALYDSLCITADGLNVDPVLVSDYLEAHQTSTGWVVDFIKLKPSGRLELPRNRQIQALNRPMVLGTAWDIVMIVAR